MDVVEIDDAIIRVAKDQFGFKTSDKTKVFHEDGIQFVQNYGTQ
jgi:spermidine synthase